MNKYIVHAWNHLDRYIAIGLISATIAANASECDTNNGIGDEPNGPVPIEMTITAAGDGPLKVSYHTIDGPVTIEGVSNGWTKTVTADATKRFSFTVSGDSLANVGCTVEFVGLESGEAKRLHKPVDDYLFRNAQCVNYSPINQ